MTMVKTNEYDYFTAKLALPESEKLAYGTQHIADDLKLGKEFVVEEYGFNTGIKASVSIEYPNDVTDVTARLKAFANS